jgi:N-acetylglucosamine kinase-like BadF-type ATPase
VAIFLGIDGGGSKTTCVIGDESSVLGTGTAGGSNVIRLGEAQAREALGAAIRQACTVAHIGAEPIRSTCLGAAGAGRQEVVEVLHRVMKDLVGGEIEIVSDSVITLEAAFGGQPGVVVIAGTGSLAYGRNGDGQTARAGGWGFAVSDEGSGHWIGRSAVTAVLRAHDEGQNSGLLESIMGAWEVRNFEQIVLTANGSPPPDFSALLPRVLSAADSGDSLARGVLTQAGTELATLAKIVIRRLFPEGGAVPLAMSGGVFRNSPLVCQVFYNNLRSEFPDAVVNPGIVEPVRGALELARKHARS